MKAIHKIILISLICCGCSVSNDITGTWFHMIGDHWEHKFWEIYPTGEVNIQKIDGQILSKYLHISDDDEYLLVSETSPDSINLGTLRMNDSTMISFSNGYYFYRVQEPTTTSLSKDAFISKLTRSTVTFSTDDYIKAMYFSESINQFGYKSVDILYDFETQQATFNSNWVFQEYKGKYALSFVEHYIQISTILIDSISDYDMSGTMVVDSVAIPVLLNFNELNDSNSTSENIERVLSESQWTSFDKNEIVDNCLEEVFMEALQSESYLDFESVESAKFKVDFKDNQFLTIRTESDLDSFEKTYQYKISSDSRYIFVFERYRHGIYSDVTSLNENQSKLTLFISLPIIYKNKGYVDEVVKIQLIR